MIPVLRSLCRKQRKKYIPTTPVPVEAAKNTNSAAEEKQFNIKMKEVIKVVLLDELKTELLAYEEPLKELRDSL